MAKRSLRRYAPEVGAECLNWARSDLCGGRSAMTVPTAIQAALQSPGAMDRPSEIVRTRKALRSPLSSGPAERLLCERPRGQRFGAGRKVAEQQDERLGKRQAQTDPIGGSDEQIQREV